MVPNLYKIKITPLCISQGIRGKSVRERERGEKKKKTRYYRNYAEAIYLTNKNKDCRIQKGKRSMKGGGLKKKKKKKEENESNVNHFFGV